MYIMLPNHKHFDLAISGIKEVIISALGYPMACIIPIYSGKMINA